VVAWLVRNDAELALRTVTIVEIAPRFGKIGKKFAPPEGCSGWSRACRRGGTGCRPDLRLHGSGPLADDDIIAPRRRMTAADGIIAAIRRINVATTDRELIRRWDF
jgi:hypothetical protein